MDPKLRKLLRAELQRQRAQLTLIASENIASPAVLEAVGSVLTNKYSEGYPGRRYYGGNEIIDTVERLAIERAKRIFHADYANVQPHAGAIANVAVFLAFLKPGDTILSLALDAGGHLTHGYIRNISGKYFNVVHYGVDRDGWIDEADVERLAKKHRPKMIISGASAYPRIINFKKFGQIAKSVGAIHLADIAHIAGLVAAGLHPSPIPHADVVTTTTHKTLRGPRGAMILGKKEHAALLDRAVMPGLQGGPLDHVIAGKAQAFAEALEPSFKKYQRQVVANAKTLASELERHGLHLSTGGTDNHLILADVTPLGVTGAEAEAALESIGLTVNKNLIPHDPRPPLNPSGLRLGTPAVTSRGLHEKDMVILAKTIIDRLRAPKNTKVRKQTASVIATLAKRHPIYPTL